MAAITFVIPGQTQTAATRGGDAAAVQAEVPGRVKQSVRVSPTARAGAEEVRVEAIPGEDVVVLSIEGGPKLTLHPENARELFLAQSAATRSSAGDKGPNVIAVPAQLQWRALEPGGEVRGATRGFLGDVVLSGVDIIKSAFTDAAENFVASAVVRKLDGQVNPGVYKLQRSNLPTLKHTPAPPRTFAATRDGGPHLVFIHGTFSNTEAAFGKLWSDHPDRVRRLFAHYKDEVLALDHQTLGVSPIVNAFDLASAAPANARLHLVTHSRGGLVAEVLARACALPNSDLKILEGDDAAARRKELKQLFEVVKQKNLAIERIVRVACPARGTLLASKRLDAYVSIFKWTLELAGVPVLPEIIAFLGAVAKHRADGSEMPGLAAQIPDSSLIRWLHDGAARIPGDLRVIAGDVQGDSIKSWLKTLLADSFYWTDNDLVVQTRSMYGGSPRAAKAQFLLHQAGNVSHGLYFKNERTAEATVAALTEDAPADFRPIGPLSWAGESSTGVRGVRRSATAGMVAANKPAAFLLPGILGSNLKQSDDRIWLAWRVLNGLDRLEYTPGKKDGVVADGPIGVFYDALADFLATTHEVVEFGFDWRRPLEDEARRLGEAVTRALDARARSNTPVRIVAHSMGGVLARTFMLEAPDVWRRMIGHAGARLLMLGTPNGGSYAPMQVLSGDDTLGNVVSLIGAPFQEATARQLIAGFPGLLQLQADLLDEKRNLGTMATWRQLADNDRALAEARNWWHRLPIQLKSLEWGVPNQATLNAAKQLRQRLDRQREEELPDFKDKLLLVVGKAPLTPIGFEETADGVVYLNVPESGDGRVTRQSAQLPGVRTWFVPVSHGSLPSEKSAFQGYLDLLEQGTTSRLQLAPEVAATRGAGPAGAGDLVRTRPAHVARGAAPAQAESDVVSGFPPDGDQKAPAEPLRVTVTNGDLSFIRQPVFIGHYQSSKLTGTERVMNSLIGGSMQTALDVGLYPDNPGRHQVFVNTRQPENPLQSPRPEAVIVVGLGEEGSLQGSELATTVRQAVVAWVQRMAERPKRPAMLEIAATLIGSGGSGIGAGQSAQLIAAGVQDANDAIRQLRNNWPSIGHLHLIELYLDRASEACRALLMLARTNPTQFIVSETVHEGQGPLRRTLDSSYRGAEYDFITAVSSYTPDAGRVISYTVDTRRARTEIRDQQAQSRLLHNFIKSASNDSSGDEELRRALFRLLIPIGLEPFLDGSSDLQIELDSETARIPWELLDPGQTSGQARKPWAIRTKLLRKLRTRQFRAVVTDASPDLQVLVIGEPKCDLEKYPKLPGARAEARAVYDLLTREGALPRTQVKSLIPPGDAEGFDAQTIVKTVIAGSWRIVHIAGHGEPPEEIDDRNHDPDCPPILDPRGIVLSDGSFLGPKEIENMRTVPELVFVNCCHLGLTALPPPVKGARVKTVNWSEFAAGVADQLIRIGVRCVIAAGWAVEDGPAKVFATRFYDALLRGRRFLDAVGEAREAAYQLGGNTWGAYQCYGDPDWEFRVANADSQAPARSLVDEFDAVTSPTALRLALDTMAVRSKFQKWPKAEQQARLRHLEERFSGWLDQGLIAEGFGLAWTAADDRRRAIDWFERAMKANDGGASMHAAEQLANLRTREAVSDVGEAETADDRAKAIKRARTTIKEDIRLLKTLLAVDATAEREVLLGSAYKRTALLERMAGNKAAEADANALVLEHYSRGETLARAAKLHNVYYPAMNRMAAELVMEGGKADWKGLDAAAMTEATEALTKLVQDDAEFWNISALTELHIYRAVQEQKLAAEAPKIEHDFADLQSRLNAPREWRTVYDQADYVLSAYRERTKSKTEQDAVDTLLGKLAGWAGVKRAAQAKKNSPARPRRS